MRVSAEGWCLKVPEHAVHRGWGDGGWSWQCVGGASYGCVHVNHTGVLRMGVSVVEWNGLQGILGFMRLCCVLAAWCMLLLWHTAAC